MKDSLRQLLEMIRFSHTLFALPFALLASVMAWMARTPSGELMGFRWRDLLGILVCMVAARSAAMAFNRIADRTFDAGNPRTAGRHLPTGAIRLATAVWFTIAASLLFVIGTLLFLPNRLPLYLALPVLGFLFGYSYAKRFTVLSHFWLGVSLLMAPLAAWIAIRGAIVQAHPADVLPAFCLGGAVLFWVAGFDMIYACQDVEFDRRAKLFSLPARWGVLAALRVAAVCHAVSLGLLVAVPWISRWGGHDLNWGWLYGVTIVAIAALLVYEHLLVRPRDLSRINVAFFQVNAVISLGLFICGTLDLLVL
jgi:4-hydroxybenzoate polyprenyltransferase